MIDWIGILGPTTIYSMSYLDRMGLYMNHKNAIRVIVPRDLHIGNEEFDSVNVGNVITSGCFSISALSALYSGLSSSKVVLYADFLASITDSI